MDKRNKTSSDNLGAYTKPKWRLGKTVAIRVPLAIKDELIEIARKLDNGEKESSKSLLVVNAIEKLREATTSKKDGGSYDGRKGRELKSKVLEVIEMLESI